MRSQLVLVAAATTAVYATSPQKRSTTDPTQLSGKTFDFLIVGGGTAGLALAARLAEWTNITVAVIEAGTDGSEYQQQITVPGMSYLNGLTGTSYDWQYTTTAQANAGGGELKWPRGKGLGGSSAINGGFWCRGSSAEYDAWNTLQNGAAGAEDWGWNTMQTYIKKAETFTPMSDTNAATMGVTHDVDAHGTSGPIQASYSWYQFSQLSNWIPTLVAMGLPHTLDPANGTNIGVTFVPSIINPANGSRSDSNFGYIAPYSGTNLVILTGYQVTKINWNSTTTGAAVAGGVTFSAGAGQQTYTVNAAKEVIVSGGSIGSPQVLQLSGVGPKSLVTSLGIDSVIDLPGVGSNLQDHLSSTIYLVATDNNTWAELKLDQDLWNQQLAIWQANGTGMFTYWNEATAYPAMADLMGSNISTWLSSLDVTSALSTAASAASMDSTVEAGVKAQYALLADWAASSSIGQVELIFSMYGQSAGAIGLQFCIQHAFSRGYVQINSASAFDYPSINPNYLSISYDADIMRAAFKYVRQIMATAPMSDAISGETLPGSGTTADVDIDYYIAHNSGTEYHPTGTNSMLPLSMGGVVNTSLVVYGTTNVRVVDVSIVPLSVSAHTMATAYGVAERAADLIKAAYGAPILASSNGSTTDSGSGSGSGSGSSSGDQSSNNLTTTKSGMSTAAKAGIGAAAGVAAIALLAVLLAVRRRNANKRRIPPGVGKEDPWYADDDLPMQPRAPFMSADKRHSAQPSEISTDTAATLMHPDGQEYGKDGQPQQGQFASTEEFSPYGAVHSNLTTTDFAPLQHSPPLAQPYTDSPRHSAPQHSTMETYNHLP
ncbi:Choline dehydrogenase [Mycena sanguinolenta]|uniref:Choline dehydrogenase n=1 Tax=Mycena sanguinolenta TaxID=230812 RepID=A0A8H6X6Y9_9AGAR|nr:Choline dehydrogenase [Mycena sanguinolenta]